MYAVGIMSGTSLDGVDVVIAYIEGVSIDTKVSIVEFETFDIPSDIKMEIKKACDEKQSSVDLICSLNFKLGYLFADCVKKLCARAQIQLKDISFIGSHGQTIYHLPNDKGNLVKSTLQIGEPAVIAYETGIKVVSNFRTMDMAAGGQGAPLVPYSEYILYSNISENAIAMQNIGGIGNVTVIDKKSDSVFAFDTGPGNMIINEACEILFDKSYDMNGEIAARGKVNKELIDYLMNHEYLKKDIPKTTGREDFGEFSTKKIVNDYFCIDKYDMIATLTMFTARSIAKSYKMFIQDKYKLDMVILSGGGVHNKTLVKFIKDELSDVNVITQEELGYNSDAKEALAFVILANETLNGNTSNLRSATNAKKEVVLGNITLGNKI